MSPKKKKLPIDRIAYYENPPLYTHKPCLGCFKNLPKSQYYKDNNKDGLSSRCKKCRSAQICNWNRRKKRLLQGKTLEHIHEDSPLLIDKNLARIELLLQLWEKLGLDAPLCVNTKLVEGIDEIRRGFCLYSEEEKGLGEEIARRKMARINAPDGEFHLTLRNYTPLMLAGFLSERLLEIVWADESLDGSAAS